MCKSLPRRRIVHGDVKLELFRGAIARMHLELVDHQTQLSVRLYPGVVQREREADGNVQPAALRGRHGERRRAVVGEERVHPGEWHLSLQGRPPALVRVGHVDLPRWVGGCVSIG